MERVNSTIFFLRMAAVELRRLAERFPDLADELHTIGKQLDAEAEELAANSQS